MASSFRQASSSFRPSWYALTSTVATLPILAWTHDSLYSVCRVRGASMEPTLKDGDVVLVRKSDVWNPRALPPSQDDPKQVERQKVNQIEQMHCKSNGSHSWLLQKPPSILSGSVVVYKSPQEYPADWTIKRVIGLGGQVVLSPLDREAPREHVFQSVYSTSVAPYSLWVEGDNRINSRDSKDYGPVSKKLVVGLAEYVLWPPTRMGSIAKSSTPSAESSNPHDLQSIRAYWP